MDCAFNFQQTCLQCIVGFAMAGRTYTLDFSGKSGVPSQLGVDINFVSKIFREQIKDLQDGAILGSVILSDVFRKRGVFQVTALTKEAATALENFVLQVEKGTIKVGIPLRQKSSKQTVFVKFYQSCEAEMAMVGDGFFDNLLIQHGATIIKPTVKLEFRDAKGLYNGVREAHVELGANHIPRWHTWTSDNGDEYRYKLVYRRQPFECRQCEEEHYDGQCPRWKTKGNGRNNNNNRNRNGNNPIVAPKILVFGDSMIRMLKDDVTMRVDAIPGARIGHVANHINNDVTILPHGEVVIVSVGRNMEMDDIETTKVAAKEEVEELVKVLAPYNTDSARSIFLVDPSVGEIGQGREYDYPRFIRAELERAAGRIGCQFVSLADVDFHALDIHQDGIHYSGSGTRKVMSRVREAVNAKIGKEVMGPVQVAENPYQGCSERHFKVGCMRCSRFHDEWSCPPYGSVVTPTPTTNTTTTAAAAAPTYSAVVSTATSSSTAAASTATSSSAATPAAPTTAVATPPSPTVTTAPSTTPATAATSTTTTTSSSSSSSAPSPSAVASGSPLVTQSIVAPIVSTQEALSDLATGGGGMEEEEGNGNDEDVILPTQLPKRQRKSRRRKTAAEAAAEIEEAAVEEVENTLQGDESWASQVEEEEERREAASAAATLEVLTAAEEEEEEENLAAAIAKEVREAAAAHAEAVAEAELFATSTPTSGRVSAGSVESGNFPLTPEMETAVSRIGEEDESSVFSSINVSNAVGASPALPSTHPLVVVTPAPTRRKTAAAAAAATAATTSSAPLVASHNIMLLPPTAGLALSAATSPLPVQGAEAAPTSINSSSVSPALMALISNSAVQMNSNGKVAISRLPPRNSRSVSVKRQGDSDYLESSVANAAKRNPSASRNPLNPNISQQDLMASLATNQRQQQQRGRTAAKGGQKGGRGGL